jgi:hypothetical protein
MAALRSALAATQDLKEFEEQWNHKVDLMHLLLPKEYECYSEAWMPMTNALSIRIH